MDDLPASLIVEILSRLTDSADLARCRVACKSFNFLSADVRSINLTCSLSRYRKSRSPGTRAVTTPFKDIFKGLIRRCRVAEAVSIGVEKSLGGISYDDVEDESDDLYLTDVGFAKEWLPRVCGELKSLSISDFWMQSCWRRSDILALVSSCCHNLRELEVKNAWLSVDGLSPMHLLTSLTLEFIRLDDEDLKMVNRCFPNLQVLNLIGVGGLKDPYLDLPCLKSCEWTVSNAPQSLTIYGSNLVKLKLKCIQPNYLLLDTPLLSDFTLSLEKANFLKVKRCVGFKSLQLESLNLCGLVYSFPCDVPIERLTLVSWEGIRPIEMTKLSLETLFDAFPNVRSLTLRSGVWLELETCFRIGGLQTRTGMKCVKEIIAQLVILDIDVTLLFITCILDQCTNLTDMSLLIQHEVYPNVASNLISRCKTDHPRVRWKWGMWKEGTEDKWVWGNI